MKKHIVLILIGIGFNLNGMNQRNEAPSAHLKNPSNNSYQAKQTKKLLFFRIKIQQLRKSFHRYWNCLLDRKNCTSEERLLIVNALNLMIVLTSEAATDMAFPNAPRHIEFKARDE